MPTAIGPFLIQDADDGPGILTQADDGKLFMWSEPDKHVIMVAPPAFQQMIMRGGGYSIQQATDGPGALTIADNAKALVWNQATGHFIMSTVNAADADTLDGHDSTYFLPAASYTAADVLSKLLTVDGSGSTLDADTLDGHDTAYFLAASSYTAADVLSKIETVDGSGSGLDADLLDGINSTGFFVLAGQAGGQTGYGGTAASENLTLDSTVHATKGFVIIQPGGGSVGMGTTTPNPTGFGGGAFSYKGFASNSTGTFEGIGNNITGAGVVGRFSSTHFYGSTNTTVGFLEFLRASADDAVDFRIRLRVAGGSPTEYFRILSTGQVGVGVTAPTAFLDVAASTTAKASLRSRVGATPTAPNDGDLWYDGALTFYGTDATTAAIVDTLRLRRASSGTPAAGFGVGVSARLMSSTTANRDAGRLTWAWITATDASRAAQGQLSAFYTTTERPVITWGANSTVPLLSFYDVTTPIAKPTRGATLTNNVTAGGTTDQIDDFVGTLYATDAAAIRNDIYQLARALRQIDVGLRALGLFT